MESKRAAHADIDAYIADARPEVRPVLERVRATVRKAAPEASETISYQMPAFTQGGILIYFAAFKQHLGVYPPVRGDAALESDCAPYAGEKGNLKFPFDQPIPYPLIARIVKHNLRRNLAKKAAPKKVAPKKAAPKKARV